MRALSRSIWSNLSTRRRGRRIEARNVRADADMKRKIKKRTADPRLKIVNPIVGNFFFSNHI